MPELESSTLANGKTEVKFQPSPNMSTYLLAFCVGEFDYVAGTTKHGVGIKVYTPPGELVMQ
jgi:puromycin-sensitive aminopeptidase